MNIYIYVNIYIYIYIYVDMYVLEIENHSIHVAQSIINFM